MSNNVFIYGDDPNDAGESVPATLGEWHEYVHLEGKEAARFFLGVGVPDIVLDLAGITLAELEDIANGKEE